MALEANSAQDRITLNAFAKRVTKEALKLAKITDYKLNAKFQKHMTNLHVFITRDIKPETYPSEITGKLCVLFTDTTVIVKPITNQDNFKQTKIILAEPDSIDQYGKIIVQAFDTYIKHLDKIETDKKLLQECKDKFKKLNVQYKWGFSLSWDGSGGSLYGKKFLSTMNMTVAPGYLTLTIQSASYRSSLKLEFNIEDEDVGNKVKEAIDKIDQLSDEITERIEALSTWKHDVETIV